MQELRGLNDHQYKPCSPTVPGSTLCHFQNRVWGSGVIVWYLTSRPATCLDVEGDLLKMNGSVWSFAALFQYDEILIKDFIISEVIEADPN